MHPHSGSMKLEYKSKSACRIMVDWLSDDTVNTIQKEQVDGSFNVNLASLRGTKWLPQQY